MSSCLRCPRVSKLWSSVMMKRKLGGLSCPEATLELRVTSNSRENRLMGRSRAVTRFMVMIPGAVMPVQRSSNEGWQFGLFYPAVQTQISANVDHVRHQGEQEIQFA